MLSLTGTCLFLSAVHLFFVIIFTQTIPFLIFALGDLWEHLSNEQAVHIAIILMQVVQKGLVQEAARKREMRHSDLWKTDKNVRRHFLDDVTVIVLFMSHDLICRGMGEEEDPIQSLSHTDNL